MRTTWSRSNTLGVLAGVVAVAGTTGCYREHWEHPHTPEDLQSAAASVAERPECRSTWSGSRIEVLPGNKARARAGIVLSTATTYTVQPTGFVTPGPITDIPEFHDCQRFIREDRAAYDSLFAVFAAYNLDAIMAGLGIDPVVWTTSNAAVATVTAAGTVTTIAGGVATIIGRSTVEPARSAAVTLTVNPAASAADTAMSLTNGTTASVSRRPGVTIAMTGSFGAPTSSVLAAAQIYTNSGGYPHLGIGRNFSCLFIYFNTQGQLVGNMVAVGDLGSGVDECTSSVNHNDDQGTKLRVIRSLVSDPNAHPAAARWDFDPVNQRYYVGIKCGNAWCEVGAGVGTLPLTQSAAFVSTSTDPGVVRVMRGKGWYDQQELAWLPPAAPGATAPALAPSGIRATVFPAPNLDALAGPADFNKWKETGYIALDVSAAVSGAAQFYKDKLNLDPAVAGSTLAGLNTISMCYGTRFECKVPSTYKGRSYCADVSYFRDRYMWARLTPSSGDESAATYRCVTRRSHADMPGADRIVPTSRWRWLPADETVWEYCAAYGCCEVVGGQN